MFLLIKKESAWCGGVQSGLFQMTDDEFEKMVLEDHKKEIREIKLISVFMFFLMVIVLAVIPAVGCTIKSRGLIYDIHDKEFCVADEDLKLQCVNKNLDKQTYERELQPGDVITNSNDAMRATTELIDIISDLKRCQSEG